MHLLGSKQSALFKEPFYTSGFVEFKGESECVILFKDTSCFHLENGTNETFNQGAKLEITMNGACDVMSPGILYP